VGPQNLAIFAAALAVVDKHSIAVEASEDGSACLLATIALMQGVPAWAADGHALASFTNALTHLSWLRGEDRVGEDRVGEDRVEDGGHVGDAETQEEVLAMLREATVRAAEAGRLNGQDVAMLAHALHVLRLADAHAVKPNARDPKPANPDTLTPNTEFRTPNPEPRTT
jgi:hypothetical protein